MGLPGNSGDAGVPGSRVIQTMLFQLFTFDSIVRLLSGMFGVSMGRDNCSPQKLDVTSLQYP